jgi:surfactin synthase thioesterase subunit
MLPHSGHEDGVTLFCLPYAGGSAAIYRAWQGRVPSWVKLIPLHMPGRGVRHAVPPMHRWSELLDVLAEDMQPHLGRPFGIFGHSLGALVGFELAHAVRERYDRTPLWLGVSACKAPVRHEPKLHWLTCPESEFLDGVRVLEGMPGELLDNREFMDLVLPFLRADFHLSGSYSPGSNRPRQPLECPMLALGGTEDPEIAADPQNLSAWAAETRGRCLVREIPAGHFFIDTHRDAVIDFVVEDLARAYRSRGPFGESLRQSYA